MIVILREGLVGNQRLRSICTPNLNLFLPPMSEPYKPIEYDPIEPSLFFTVMAWVRWGFTLALTVVSPHFHSDAIQKWSAPTHGRHKNSARFLLETLA